MSGVGDHYENLLCAFNFPIVCTFNPEMQAYIPLVDIMDQKHELELID